MLAGAEIVAAGGTVAGALVLPGAEETPDHPSQYEGIEHQRCDRQIEEPVADSVSVTDVGPISRVENPRADLDPMKRPRRRAIVVFVSEHAVIEKQPARCPRRRSQRVAASPSRACGDDRAE